jgi:hypothetical protein
VARHLTIRGEEASLKVELSNVARGGAVGRVLWRPRGPRLTLSLRQILLDPADSLAMEDHSRVTLCQQGAETQFSWYCTIETTSATTAIAIRTTRSVVARSSQAMLMSFSL